MFTDCLTEGLSCDFNNKCKLKLSHDFIKNFTAWLEMMIVQTVNNPFLIS